MALEYWLKGDIPPGPIKTTIVDITRAVDILKRYKDLSIILIGSNINNIEKLINANILEKIIELSKTLNAPIATANPNIIQRLDNTGFTNYITEFPLDIVKTLSRKNHSYKLAILIGFIYSYAWLLLNHIKHYKPNINTLSLDPYPHPNATWTLPLLPIQIWFKNLSQIIEILKSSTIQINV